MPSRGSVILAVTAGILVAGCQSGDEMTVSNTTAVPIVFESNGADLTVDACTNGRFESIADGWRPMNGTGAIPSPGDGVRVDIRVGVPLDGFGSSRHVVIVSTRGVDVREGDDASVPSNCVGAPPPADRPSPTTDTRFDAPSPSAR